MQMNNQNPEVIYAGFGDRVGAFLIDCTITIAIGYITGFALRDYLAQTGSWSSIIGLAIIVIYFGLFNSKLFNGKTPGKRLFNLMTIDANSNHISLFRSFQRSSLFFVPPYWVLVNLDFSASSYWATYVVALIPLLFLGFYGFYFILNGPTYGTIHDLLTGTAVVKGNMPATTISIRFRKKRGLYAFVFALVFCVLSAVPYALYSAGVIKRVSEWDIDTYMAFKSEVNSIESINGVRLIPITRNNDGTVSIMEVEIIVMKNLDYLESNPDSMWSLESVKELEEIIDRSSIFEETSIVSLTLKYGFDIGIARFYQDVSSPMMIQR